MLIMPSNNTGFEAGRLFERYKGQLGHLHNPARMRQPFSEVPWSMDNGVFGAWQSKKPWDELCFYKALEKYCFFSPLWVVVPDSVGDRGETLRLWEKHSDKVKSFGVKVAFAVQDGMTEKDVPEKCVVFVGGTTSWKFRNLERWKGFRFHVGRINTFRCLEICYRAGADSCDGTGWFRDPKRTKALESWLNRKTFQEEFKCI